MKYISTVLLIFGTLFTTILYSQGHEIKKLYILAEQLVALEEESGFDVGRLEFAILEKNEAQKYSLRELSELNTYHIIAAADGRITKIGVELLEEDSNGDLQKLRESESSDKPYGTISFKPSITKDYVIKVSAKGFDDKYLAGRYFMLLAYQPTDTIPSEPIGPVVEPKPDNTGTGGEVKHELTVFARQTAIWKNYRKPDKPKKIKYNNDLINYDSKITIREKTYIHLFPNDKEKKYQIVEDSHNSRSGKHNYKVYDMERTKIQYHITYNEVESKVYMYNTSDAENITIYDVH